MPCLFFSLLFLLVFPQYIAGLLRKKDLLKNKAARIIGVAAIALLVLFPAFSIILNGFAEVSHRVFYCILPFFAVFSAVGLQNILKEKRLNVWLLLGTSVAGIMVFLYTYNRVIVNGPMAEEAWFKKFLAADTVGFHCVIGVFAVEIRKEKQGILVSRAMVESAWPSAPDCVFDDFINGECDSRFLYYKQ